MGNKHKEEFVNFILSLASKNGFLESQLARPEPPLGRSHPRKSLSLVLLNLEFRILTGACDRLVSDNLSRTMRTGTLAPLCPKARAAYHPMAIFPILHAWELQPCMCQFQPLPPSLPRQQVEEMEGPGKVSTANE
jgi:hypothetical protein